MKNPLVYHSVFPTGHAIPESSDVDVGGSAILFYENGKTATITYIQTEVTIRQDTKYGELME